MAIGAVTRSGAADLDVVKKRIGEVLQRVNRYRAGEAEVAAASFQSPRTKEEHLRWLKSQMVRELGWPDGRLTRVMEAYKEVEKETDRHLVHDLLINAEEEYSHYVVLADIAEELAGKRITPEEIEYNRELPEWKALAAVRTRQGEWDAAVSGFHEGGGLGIYSTCMHLKPLEGDPYREKFAQAMAMIYGDEVGHAAQGFRAVVRIAATAADEQWQQVLEKAEAVGYHRARMRNEQFGFPLSEARIAEVREGQIVPYLSPLPDMEEVYQEVVTAD
jgi:hypothetical protein